MKKGFTLIELLVAITLSSLMLVAIYGVYISSSQMYRRYVAQAELSQNARITLERISRDLRQTQRIITELPLNNSDPLNPPPSSIQFQDGHNETNTQYIRYYLQNQELRVQYIHYYFSSDPNTWVAWNQTDEFGNPPLENVQESVKANKITSLKFYGSNIITIELITSDGQYTYNFRTQILGRNIK